MYKKERKKRQQTSGYDLRCVIKYMSYIFDNSNKVNSVLLYYQETKMFDRQPWRFRVKCLTYLDGKDCHMPILPLSVLHPP